MSADPLGIDPDNLDTDCAGHARLFRNWARSLALADKKVKELKNDIKALKAEIRKRVRSDPAAFGLDKATVDAVDDEVELDGPYQDRQAQLVQAEYERDDLQGMVDALRERGQRMKDMVLLHGQSYWAAPRADPATRQRYAEQKRDSVNADAAKAAGTPGRKSPGKK